MLLVQTQLVLTHVYATMDLLVQEQLAVVGCGTVLFYFTIQVGLALDVYSGYEKFLLPGDFNIEEQESPLREFLYERNTKNLVKEATCFKNPVIEAASTAFLLM